MKERSFHGKLGELSPGERQALHCLLFPCLAISWFIKQVLCLPVGPDNEVTWVIALLQSKREQKSTMFVEMPLAHQAHCVG